MSDARGEMAERPKVAVMFDEGVAGRQTHARRLAEDLSLPFHLEPAPLKGALLLAVTADGLELRDGDSPQTKGVCADFTSIDLRTGAGNLSHRQPLARAIGRAAETVLDATAGLGHDATLLALMGYVVTAVERSPIIGVLLEDGLERALADERYREALGGRLRVIIGEAREVLRAMEPPPDAVYVDPMFPPKRKASALAKKSIRLLRRVVGDDDDAAELVDAALQRPVRRVVVKRPTHAPPLRPDPAVSFPGKLVRYDVYVRSPAGAS
jgi:16S rRNA (guanine1516-N2)-methyltransferase